MQDLAKKKINIKSPAKINLHLEVIGKREDGFHELAMIMQNIDLADYLEFEINNEGLISYYTRVVEEVGETQLHYLLYHIPQMSNVNIDFNVIEKLLYRFPNNIIGIKDSSGDVDNMIKMIKIFKEFSVFSGSDSLALKAVGNGGAGAITAVSNISGKLLSFLINNWKEESSISNFSDLQKLQEEIRSAALHHQPISSLKAFLSIRDNNIEWNRLLPPLINLQDPSNNTTVISLLELTKKMNLLLSRA